MVLSIFSCSSKEPVVSIPGLSLTILPSSRTHSPNSTWWGYNMTKISRFGASIYYGIIEGDTGATTTLADFVIYKKKDGLPPARVASIPVSRPGNVLVDPSGKLHVIAFEPYDVSICGWCGSLVHYEYANVQADDFSQTSRTVIRQALSPTDEVVNIRVGATSNGQGHLAVSYGLFLDPVSNSKTLFLYTKAPNGAWTEQKITQLPTDYWYPYVVYKDSGRAFLLPVQDEFVPGPPAFNRYYKIPFFSFDGASWSESMLFDLSQDPLAITDQYPEIAEQSELFERSNGEVIAIYKDRKNPQNFEFKMRFISALGAVGPETPLQWTNGRKVIWIRAFEVGTNLYFLAIGYDTAYIVKADTNEIKQVGFPGMRTVSYPYLSSGRGGAFRNHLPTLDLLMFTGDQQNYPSPGSQLYQVPKQSIADLF